MRNASKPREDVHDFFENELSEKVREMVEKKFPAVSNENE